MDVAAKGSTMEVIRSRGEAGHSRRGSDNAAAMAPGNRRVRNRKAQLSVTGVLVAAGAWLAVSPLVAGYARLHLLSSQNALAGLAIVVLAVLTHSGRPRGAPLTLLLAGLAGLAAWLLVAPWLLGYGTVLLRNSEPGQATWNGMFVAAVVLAAVTVRAFLARRSPGAAATTANGKRM